MAPRGHEGSPDLRGPDERTQHVFSYRSPEQPVPADGLLRTIRALPDDALRSMSLQFQRMYSTMDPCRFCRSSC